MRKENRDEDKILRDMDFTFNPEKDHYEPKETVSDFNNNYIEYESIGDKDKALLLKDYLDVIRPYLSHMINNHKNQGEWKTHLGNTITDYKIQGEWEIHLKIAINFISSKDSDETCTMHTESNNIEIIMGSETDEIIEEFFASLLQRSQEGLEESMKGSEFIFDRVGVNGGGSCIDSS